MRVYFAVLIIIINQSITLYVDNTIVIMMIYNKKSRLFNDINNTRMSR